MQTVPRQLFTLSQFLLTSYICYNWWPNTDILTKSIVYIRVHCLCCTFYVFFFLILTWRHFSHCFERERKRKEREALISCLLYAPWPEDCTHRNWGWNLQPRYVLWPGIRPSTSQLLDELRPTEFHWPGPVYGFWQKYNNMYVPRHEYITIQNSFIFLNPLCSTYSALAPSPQSLATTDLFTVSIVLPFLELHILWII